MSSSQRPYIEFGVLVLGASILAFFFAIVVFLFGIDYLNAYLALAGMGSALIGAIGVIFLFLSGTLTFDPRSFSKLAPPSIFYTGLSLIIFSFVDAFIPRYFSVQLFGFPLASLLDGLTLSQVVQVGFVFTIGEAIMEELLRMGVANVIIRFVDPKISWFVAPAGLFLLFFVIHIPAYHFDVPILFSLGIGPGAIITIFDMRTMDGLTGVLSHAINNGAAWAVTSSILVLPQFALVVTVAVVPSVLALQLMLPVLTRSSRLHLGRSR